MSRIRLALIALLVLAAFLWGTAVGFYQVFPYEALRTLKNGVERDEPEKRALFTNPDAYTVADADLILDTRPQVVMLGDSVTAGGRWQEMFPDAGIVNRGVGGDTVSGLLRRAPRVAQMGAKQIFVLVGINDIVSGNRPDEILPLYDKAIAILRSGGALVYVQPSLGCGVRCDDEQRGRQQAFNAALPGIAARHGAIWLDLNRSMAAGGRLKPDYTWDGMHLTGAGYAAWRDALRPLIRPAGDAIPLTADPR
ncbi:MAG TPA: GDSL-type esterase/lipase family protein [Sphingomonas sp.]|jgi:lysophospholipase L1-like esterase|nr:GDSL-type esterase/lipase family protein [Sphingomonas sp.]